MTWAANEYERLERLRDLLRMFGPVFDAFDDKILERLDVLWYEMEPAEREQANRRAREWAASVQQLPCQPVRMPEMLPLECASVPVGGTIATTSTAAVIRMVTVTVPRGLTMARIPTPSVRSSALYIGRIDLELQE